MRPGVRVSRTVVPDSMEDIPVRVVNLNNKPVDICAGTLVSDLEPVEVCGTQEGNPLETGCEDTTLRDMVDGVDRSVSDGDRRRLLAVLKEFSSTFSRGNNDLGRTDVITHTIDTGDSKPVRQPLRRHPPAYEQAIRQHVRDMLEQGVIERDALIMVTAAAAAAKEVTQLQPNLELLRQNPGSNQTAEHRLARKLSYLSMGPNWDSMDRSSAQDFNAMLSLGDKRAENAAQMAVCTDSPKCCWTVLCTGAKKGTR